MILLDAATDDEAIIPQLAVFAAQLRAAGLDVAIAHTTVPDDLGLTQKYDLLPFVRDISDVDITGLIVIGAEIEDDARLSRFQRLNFADDAPVLLLGAFETPQEMIATRANYAMITGIDPDCVDLGDMPGVLAGTRPCPCFGVATPTETVPFLRGRDPIQFLAINAHKGKIFPALKLLSGNRNQAPVAYVTTADKAAWVKQNGPGDHLYSFSEIMPTSLSAFGDVLIVTGVPGGNFRALSYLNNHVAKGSVIVDATPNGDLVAAGIPALEGPGDPAFLSAYLKEVVLPHVEHLRKTVPDTAYAKSISLAEFLKGTAFADRLKPTERPGDQHPPRINFVPTNGIGLGHAQRCSLVAAELPKTERPPRFFAFPSCLPMIRGFGFDATPLISRTSYHEPRTSSDLINYSRIFSDVHGQDTLVFDGGNVYHSIFRSVIEHRMRAVWIRRGLWKKEQDNSGPLEREKFFTRVIVPREAFDELNQDYSSGDHLHQVGPIVQQVSGKVSRDTIRAGLKEKFGRDFDKLVVTMLGSGVVSDLSAHSQTIAGMVEERDDCLNLIIVWPTSGVPMAWYGWKNTYVVSSHHAGLLQYAADLFVSAAGFNSFHEALYNNVPTIFIPQEGTSLDDQLARAEAASERGLASCVPWAKIGKLAGEARRFLNRGKDEEIRKALAEYNLPEPGNRHAAELIAEVAS